MTRLTKSLIDGGSGLNLMYLDTFEGLGLTREQLQSNPHPFYGVVPGKESIPLGWVTLPITFRDASNNCTETLVFEVVDFSEPYMSSLGGRVMSSSWLSPPTPISSSRYPSVSGLSQ
jgi:hypothetical protein